MSHVVTAVAHVPAVAQVGSLAQELLHVAGVAKKYIFLIKNKNKDEGSFNEN